MAKKVSAKLTPKKAIKSIKPALNFPQITKSSPKVAKKSSFGLISKSAPAERVPMPAPEKPAKKEITKKVSKK